MQRLALHPLVLVFVSLAGAGSLQSQTLHLGMSAGGILPIGEYGGNDQLGWHVMGMGETSVRGFPVSFRADALYGVTAHQGGIGGSTRLTGVTGDIVWHPGVLPLLQRLYLLGGMGFYTVRVGVTGFAPASQMKLAFAGGLGGVAGLGATRIFGEARFVDVPTSGSATYFVLFSAGVSLGLR